MVAREATVETVSEVGEPSNIWEVVSADLVGAAMEVMRDVEVKVVMAGLAGMELCSSSQLL